jgi:galactokinase
VNVVGALERARAAFIERFGCAPGFGARAPGRVNLIGEHTDYNGGFVLPVAIDLDCVALGAVAPAGERTRIVAVDLERELELELGGPLRVAEEGEGEGVDAVRRGSPGSYIAGVLERWRRLAGTLPNMRIAVASDVPLGAGLSSSAALEVAVATLMEAAMGRRLGPREKAMLCQVAEHEFAGVPCGIMDQMASVFGREGCALLIDCRDESVTPVRLPRGVEWLVVDSNVRHSLARGEYAARRRMCEDAARACGARSLREVAMPLLELYRGRLPEEQHRCARHVVSENGRVLRMAGALEAGAMEAAGTLMRESHASLRDDFRVSCAEVDALVGVLGGSEGVYGARMTGAGFGGSVVALVREGAAGGVAARVRSEYLRTFGRDASAFVVRAGAGAGEIRDCRSSR